MRRLPALITSCSFVTRSFQPFVRAGAVAILLAAVLLAGAANPASAQETLPPGIPDVDDGAHEAPAEETFVIARVLACPAADADLGSCESLAGVTLSIVLDGAELASGPLVTEMNPIGSYSADFLASTSQWLSIAAIDGLPEGYAAAAGSDPFMALVSDLPFQSCGGESLCQYADLVVVPTGDETPDPSDPSNPSNPADPEPEADSVTSSVTIYSVLCPAGTEAGALFEICYDTPAAGMPYRAGRPYTEFPETTTPTDDAGFVTFSARGDVARVIQELPVAATISVYCTADGAETGVAIVDSGNPALGVADITLTGGDVRCDWYTIPTGGAAPQPADPVTAPADDAGGDPAPASPSTDGVPTPASPSTGEDPAPTSPSTSGGGVAVTALPNTGTGTDGSSAGIARAAWMLAAIGFCGVAGLIGTAIIRGKTQ